MCAFCYLEEAAGILVTQVYIDHLQQSQDFVIAHLIIVVLVGPTQVSMNPGDKQSRNQQEMYSIWWCYSLTNVEF